MTETHDTQTDRYCDLETVLVQWADFVQSIRKDFGLLQELQEALTDLLNVKLFTAMTFLLQNFT